MDTGRLEAFTDSVIAVIITVMVLKMQARRDASVAAQAANTPMFVAYALS